MLYRLWFRDGVGHPLTLTGFKLVRDDAGFDVWKDTTTLFTHVLRGHVEAATTTAPSWWPPASAIRIRDFARQLTTFRAGGPSIGAQLGALLKFGWIFTASSPRPTCASAADDVQAQGEAAEGRHRGGPAPSGRTRVLGALAGARSSPCSAPSGRGSGGWGCCPRAARSTTTTARGNRALQAVEVVREGYKVSRTRQNRCSTCSRRSP